MILLHKVADFSLHIKRAKNLSMMKESRSAEGTVTPENGANKHTILMEPTSFSYYLRRDYDIICNYILLIVKIFSGLL